MGHATGLLTANLQEVMIQCSGTGHRSLTANLQEVMNQCSGTGHRSLTAILPDVMIQCSGRPDITVLSDWS